MSVTVHILIGPSGCGKSTYAKQIPHVGWRSIVSADSYFTDDRGAYRFDPNLLSNAHGMCLRNFTNSIQYPESHTIVVDNTNTTLIEIAPYYALAKAYNAEVEFVFFDANPVVCAQRNTHGVSEAAIRGMCERIAKLEFPPFWEFSKRRIGLDGKQVSMIEVRR